jgi:hypothetical protein
MIIDGKIASVCHTSVKNDMKIKTRVSSDSLSSQNCFRIYGTLVGGVGTPCA